MRIVFWQNCLSPHQLPYIVHLMDDKRVDEVVVVTEESISDERKKMGCVQYIKGYTFHLLYTDLKYFVARLPMAKTLSIYLAYL